MTRLPCGVITPSTSNQSSFRFRALSSRSSSLIFFIVSSPFSRGYHCSHFFKLGGSIHAETTVITFGNAHAETVFEHAHLFNAFTYFKWRLLHLDKLEKELAPGHHHAYDVIEIKRMGIFVIIRNGGSGEG